MIDKIRLFQAGRLPTEYVANLGEARPGFFDACWCRFAGVAYRDLEARVRLGGTDEEILAWATSKGIVRTDDERNVWNGFMMKIGWRDDRAEMLAARITEYRLTGRAIETMFDLIDVDEGRDPIASRAWVE